MKNLTLLISMIETYNTLAYTHNYIFGFEYRGNIYSVTTDNKYLDCLLTLSKASRDAGMALRFRPTREQKELMFTLYKPELICSKEYFENMVKDSKYNKGEIFEKMITEKNGQNWKKDSAKFTVSGDIEINNIAYQIKFEKATFASEKTLIGLMKRV